MRNAKNKMPLSVHDLANAMRGFHGQRQAVCNSDLPRSVREIADVIGRLNALRLVGLLPTCESKHHGRRAILYVPKKLNPDHHLVRVLGWAVAHKLVQGFAGEILYPAVCWGIYTRFRDRAICERLTGGETQEQVADAMALTVRRVRQIAADFSTNKD